MVYDIKKPYRFKQNSTLVDRMNAYSTTIANFKVCYGGNVD